MLFLYKPVDPLDKLYVIRYNLEYYIKLRKQHKLSQSELERITGVSRISINRYENGKIMPSVQAVNQLLVTMGYRLDIVPICDSEYEEMEEMQNEKKTDL